ncbi:MAG: 2Fe-2S iron-sulfur cluster binding domain-containing protein [Betaproteobacteria bacterium]|nr:2Fe-2S iron-sulfur cluster binding domain-containing protein [Betaproteobacteria bacterium]
MSHYLPLSRVARLVGQSRSALQRLIHDGQLATFDGMVDMNELLRVFPDVQWEEDGEFRRVEEIKANAFRKRVLDRVLPDKEVLAERLYEVGKEFAAAKALLLHYDEVFRFLADKLEDVAESGGATTQEAVAGVKHWLKHELDAAPQEAERAEQLLAQESVMRILSATVTVLPSGHEFFVEGNDTILEAALRAGIPLNYGCSNGNCGDCKVRLVSGQVKKVHPHDYVLKETEKAGGALLMCSYTAVSDVVIEAGVAGADDMPHQEIPTRVKAVEALNEQIVALHLTAPRSQRLRFLAGQRVILEAGGLRGEYPIASCPCEDRHIELHVRRDNRPFSRRVFEEMRKEDVVRVEGPAGTFVIKLDSRRPVVFVAWGEGFAPVKSLIQHAMSLEVAETMHLYWVDGDTGHYQDNLCRAWADAYDNFFYTPLSAGAGSANLVQAILAAHPDMTRCDLYAAAPEGLLTPLREAALSRRLSPLGWHDEVLSSASASISIASP